MGINPLLAAPEVVLKASEQSSQPVGEGELTLDNSMIAEGKLSFHFPAGSRKKSLKLWQGQTLLAQFYPSFNSRNKAQLRIAELMKWLPIGSRATLILSARVGRREYRKKIGIRRSAAGIKPDPSRMTRSIQPLYQRIARDLTAGKPLVITSNVVLWDWRFGAKRNSFWEDGSNPRKNLYWGGTKYAIYNGFKRVFGWKIAYEEEGKIAVFKRTFQPAGAWKKYGVTKPFEMYAVFNVYTSDKILTAYTDFARNLFGDNPQRIALDDGKVIEAGSQSQIVGYVGHMIYEGAAAIQKVRQETHGKGSRPAKGVYLSACSSAPVFGPSVLAPDNYGLLFTTYGMFPGAHLKDALFKAVGLGENGKQIIQRVGKAVKKLRGKAPGGLFVNSESRQIERFTEPWEGDADQDGINNRIDPEPGIKNESRVNKQMLVITSSSGKEVTIPLQNLAFSSQISSNFPLIKH